MPANAADIEARIAATRYDLAAAIELLVDRVSPGNVKARSQKALSAKAHAGLEAAPPWPALAAAAGAALVLLVLVRRRRHGGR